TEYSPYVFRFKKTCIEPMLMDLYEAMCKAEDDLWIIACDKTYKCKANDKENDEQVTGSTQGFFYKPVTKKRKAIPKCYYCRTLGHKIRKNDEQITRGTKGSSMN
ncbi:hypothetical protein Tco_0207682, partial [Tanacetum coccineum]